MAQYSIYDDPEIMANIANAIAEYQQATGGGAALDPRALIERLTSGDANPLAGFESTNPYGGTAGAEFESQLGEINAGKLRAQGQHTQNMDNIMEAMTGRGLARSGLRAKDEAQATLDTKNQLSGLDRAQRTASSRLANSRISSMGQLLGTVRNSIGQGGAQALWQVSRLVPTFLTRRNQPPPRRLLQGLLNSLRPPAVQLVRRPGCKVQ